MLFTRVARALRVAGVAVLLALLATDPVLAQSVEAVIEQARSAASRNSNQEAVALFEEAIRQAPGRRLELLLEYADQLAYAARPADAVPLYRERLQDPALDAAQRRRAERGLAFALLWSSQFDEAIAAWQTITQAEPADQDARKALFDATVGLARQAAERGANRDAAAAFERAIALDPAAGRTLTREYADQLAFAGEPGRAVPLYREILTRPNLPAEEGQKTRRGLAFALLWSSQFPAAIEAWEAITRGNPQDAEGRKALTDAVAGSARQAAERNRNAEAANLFRRAIETDWTRRPEFLREYADQLAYSGQARQAVPLYQEALRQGGRPPEDQDRARRGLAFALLWSGQFAEAVPALEAQAERAPNDQDVRKALEEARAGLRRQAEAPRQAEGPRPATPAPAGGPAQGQAQGTPAPTQQPAPAAQAPARPATPADAAIAEARAAAGRGDNKGAAAAFARAIALEPAKRREIGREYADQLAFSGEPAKAVPVYREVLSRTDLSAEERQRTNRALSFALLWSSQWNLAIEAWTPLLRANPQDAEARKALSDALVGAARDVAGKNRNADAANFFRRAVDTAPNRRQELLPEWADQLAYSGQPRQAVLLYREGLRRGDRSPQEQLRLRRGLAFALLWSNEYQEAIRAFDALVRENPRDAELRKAYADALVGGAREAGGARRNGESASLFARAIRVAPERRQELLREYADQVLYSGRPKDAIPLYQEVLQRTDLEPMELRNAQIGLGRAYFWSGEPDQALPYFTAILRVMPLDFEARIARGQALNAVATHRAALADFEFALQQRPGDADGLRGAARAETSLGLHRLAIARVAPLIAAGERDIRTIQIVADARRAMGRPDLSEDAAREILAIKADDETARRLLDDLLFERRPLTVAEGSYITRSDNLKIGSAQVSQEFTFDRGLTKFTPTFRFTDHRGPGFPTVDLYSIGATTKRRFNDWLELNSNLFVNFEDEPAKEDVQVTHETTVSLIPTDVWRLNFTTARRYPDENPRVIVNDIFQNDFGGSFDYTPSYDFRFTGRGIYSTYSDGNERIWGQAEFAARLGIKPDVIVGARFTAFDFKRVFDNGYWNPDAYQSLEGTLHTYGPLVERLNYDIQVAGGYAWSQPGEGGPVFNVTGRLTYDVDRAVSLSAYTNYLVSFARSASTDNGIPQTGNDDPFERLTVGGQLRVRW